MVSYNNITKLTYYYENKLYNEILDLVFELCNSTNILDILRFIKKERFIEKNSSIKLNYNEKEIIIFKENFLINIPENTTSKTTIDDFTFTLSYPNIIEHKCSPMYCVKTIEYNKEQYILKNQKDYNLIPVTTYSKLKQEIDKYIDELKNIKLYKVGNIESRFFLNFDLIINIIYIAFVTSHKSIVQEQLFLMKEYNFTYEAFDKLSFLEVRQHLTTAIKLTNERNNPEARRAH